MDRLPSFPSSASQKFTNLRWKMSSSIFAGKLIEGKTNAKIHHTYYEKKTKNELDDRKLRSKKVYFV